MQRWRFTRSKSFSWKLVPAVDHVRNIVLKDYCSYVRRIFAVPIILRTNVWTIQAARHVWRKRLSRGAGMSMHARLLSSWWNARADQVECRYRAAFKLSKVKYAHTMYFTHASVSSQRLTTMAGLYIGHCARSTIDMSKHAAPSRKRILSRECACGNGKRSENLQVQWEAEIAIASPLRSRNEDYPNDLVRGRVTVRGQNSRRSKIWINLPCCTADLLTWRFRETFSRGVSHPG